MLKNKDFKTIFCSAGNQCYQRKVVPQVNLVIPPVVNRLTSVGELRAVAIKHLAELSVEHEFFCHFFLSLFVLRFYGPVNPMGSCRARSVYLTTRLLGRLSPLSG